MLRIHCNPGGGDQQGKPGDEAGDDCLKSDEIRGGARLSCRVKDETDDGSENKQLGDGRGGNMHHPNNAAEGKRLELGSMQESGSERMDN